MAFDRDGSRVLVFERLANGDLTVNWEWALGFPEMVDWCLLRDYNCDGKADIFTSHMNGIRVFENTTAPGGAPSFSTSPTDLTASFDFGSGASELPVICIGMDLPAIVDHDDDGDLDIITFTETATTLYRFQGQSPCGLELTCTNRCYGMLEEAAENNALFIGDDFECSFNVADPGHRRIRGESDGTSRRRRADFPSTRSRRPEGFVGQRRHLPLHHWGGDGITPVRGWTAPCFSTPSSQPTCGATKRSTCRGFLPHSTSTWTLTEPKTCSSPPTPPGNQRRCRGALVQKHRVGGRPAVGVSRQRLPPTRHDRHGTGGLPGADGFRRRRPARLGHRQQGAARGHRPNPSLRGVVPQRRFCESASLRQGERRLDSVVHLPN